MNEIVANTKSEAGTEQLPLPFCGIVMPISDMGGLHDKAHWERVRLILDEAIREANYSPRLVSESEDIGVIHARIVQNLYDDPIVICDVSGKNANVMFELGLRLAFNKPTIVIKDNLTDYSFDTSPIEHINYRADLRFDDVRNLQKQLAEKIRATMRRVEEDENYTPFLGHFVKFKVAGLETKVVGKEDFVLEQLQGIQREIARLSNRIADAVPATETFNAFQSESRYQRALGGLFGLDPTVESFRRKLESLTDDDRVSLQKKRLTDAILGRDLDEANPFVSK